MLKFFRKYNKAILSVGFSLLMVVFLLPQGLQQMTSGATGQLLASFDGGAIRAGDMRTAEQEIRLLSDLDPALLDLVLRVENAEHWLLLTHQADEGGFVGGPQDGDEFLAAAAERIAQVIVSSQQRQITPQFFQAAVTQVRQARLAQMRQRRDAYVAEQGMPLEAVNRVLASAHGVLRMYNAYLASQSLSRPEAMRLARREYDSVTVKYVLLPAEILMHERSPQPTEEEIREHFDKYKTFQPGQGDHGFGYLLPDAVKLEWLAIDRSDLSAALDIDPIEANTHWRQNRDQYAETFEEARPQVEADLRSQKLEEALAEARRAVQAELLKATADLPIEGRFKQLPADWAAQRPSFEELAEVAQDALWRSHEVSADVVDVQRRDDAWLTRSDLRNLPGLGASRRTVAGRAVAFSQLAMSLRELPNATSPDLQVGLATGPTSNAEGDLFFFRVIAARPQSPPRTVAQVREQVVRDLQRLDAYRLLQANAEQYALQSLQQGMTPLGLEYGRNVRRDVEVTSNFVQPILDPAVGSEAFRSAVMDRAWSLDASVPIERISLPDRTLVVRLPEALAIAVVRIDAFNPIAEEDFRTAGADVALVVARQDLLQEDWPYTWEAMKQRMNIEYTDAAAPEGEEPAEGDVDGDEDDAGSP